MIINIPNGKELEIQSLILDLNGTIAVNGELIGGVSDRLSVLKEKGLQIYLFSGDTRGNAKKLSDDLGISFVYAGTGVEKRNAVLSLDPSTCATIGNGLIDVLLFEEVALGIAVLQKEGLNIACLKVADILAPTINDALDLFIDETSLIATLRP